MIFETTFNEITVHHNNEWCRLLWQPVGEKENYAYQVIILSSYGNWTHLWFTSSCVPTFLARLNLGYMGAKLIDHKVFMEYDEEKTSSAVIRQILQERRGRSIDEDEAREYFDAAKLGLDQHDFHHMCRESSMEDLWELEVTGPCTTWKNFWEYLWVPAVVPALLAEADNKAA